ncbi:MAG: exopolysaccharide biosynthesis protein [Proteobacteria bacterium]|nr:exopolysaccharide biosynthesis protein [Pseudomonadota bacterium]
MATKSKAKSKASKSSTTSMPQKSSAVAKAKKTQSVSELLHALADDYKEERMPLSYMFDTLSDKGFLILMMFFAAPLMLPLTPPGITLILALPLIVLSAQMLYGLKVPYLPEFLRRKTMKTTTIKWMVNSLDPWLNFLNRFVKPRLLFMTSPFGIKMIALWCFVSAVVIPVPLPVINSIASGAIFLMALGILQRDGLLVKAGMAVTVITILILVAVAFIGAEAVTIALEAAKTGHINIPGWTK